MISEANGAVMQAKAVDVPIIFWSISPEAQRIAVLAGSSAGASGREGHQKGYLIGVTNGDVNVGRRAKLSIVHKRGVKDARKAQCPQLCETYAVSDALAEGARVKALLESTTCSDFDAVLRRRRSVPRPEPRPHVSRNELPEFVDPELFLIMDS